MRVTPQCDPIDTVIICDATFIQTDPAVAFNGTDYLVVWSDWRYAPDQEIAARRVTPQGVALDTSIFVGNAGNISEVYPAIAFDGNRCLVVWNRYTVPSRVEGRFLNGLGRPEGPIIGITTTLLSPWPNPKIAFDGTNYLVIFTDKPGGSNDVYGQLISPAGNLVGSRISIATGSPNQSFADVVWDRHCYVVVWTEDSCYVKGQRVAANGQLIGSNFSISNTTSTTRFRPTIAAANTNYLVAWEQGVLNAYDIFGNVDQMVGVDEKTVIPFSKTRTPTIISGSLPFSKTEKRKIHDISGRLVESSQLRPGIYFVEVDGRITRKFIKVR